MKNKTLAILSSLILASSLGACAKEDPHAQSDPSNHVGNTPVSATLVSGVLASTSPSSTGNIRLEPGTYSVVKEVGSWVLLEVESAQSGDPSELWVPTSAAEFHWDK